MMIEYDREIQMNEYPYEKKRVKVRATVVAPVVKEYGRTWFICYDNDGKFFELEVYKCRKVHPLEEALTEN
jgi:hypothetical protein